MLNSCPLRHPAAGRVVEGSSSSCCQAASNADASCRGGTVCMWVILGSDSCGRQQQPPIWVLLPLAAEA
jgi:hypothetical protein